MPGNIEEILVILAFQKFANERKPRATVIYETIVDQKIGLSVVI